VKPVIELNNIHKSYYLGPVELKVLKGISFSVHRGELVSLMGTSGSGKSTLMNILGMLDRPSSGDYLFDGRAVVEADDAATSAIRNRSIGFVFQQFQLLPRLVARDNVALPLLYRKTGQRDRRKKAMEMLEKVGLAEHASHLPRQMSGGQQQRVAIARALVGAPSLILADEPTGALDSRVGQEIMDLFIRLNQEDGITVVIITHDENVARQCGRQIRLRDGLLVPDEELHQPLDRS